MMASKGAQPCGCDPPHKCERHACQDEWDRFTGRVDCNECGHGFQVRLYRSDAELDVQCPACDKPLLVELVEYAVSRAND